MIFDTTFDTKKNSIWSNFSSFEFFWQIFSLLISWKPSYFCFDILIRLNKASKFSVMNASLQVNSFLIFDKIKPSVFEQIQCWLTNLAFEFSLLLVHKLEPGGLGMTLIKEKFEWYNCYKTFFLLFLPRRPQLESFILIRRHPIRPKVVLMWNLRLTPVAAFSIYFNFSASHAKAKNTACFLDVGGLPWDNFGRRVTLGFKKCANRFFAPSLIFMLFYSNDNIFHAMKHDDVIACFINFFLRSLLRIFFTILINAIFSLRTYFRNTFPGIKII